MEPQAKSLRSVPLDSIRSTLATELKGESEILDRLVLELTKGQALEDLWTSLHKAAARDDRSAELAFAYERVCQPKLARVLSPPQETELLVHAAEFFGDALGDLEGAIGYLERALTISPTHVRAFERLERALVEGSDGAKLCDLYAKAARDRTDRTEQLRLLRRAAELSDVYADDAKRVLPIYEHILKLDPEDAGALRAIEAWYVRAARHGDVAKLLEQALTREPAGADSKEARAIRRRLIELYAGPLRQPERATPHAEEILRDDPADEIARGVLRGLLTSKTMGGRAAEALEASHEKLGETAEQSKMLEAQIEQLRGPKRVLAQKRLAKIRYLLSADVDALGLIERAMIADPADDEIRLMFRDLGCSLGRRAEAAGSLAKAATGTRDAPLRARIGVETAQLWLDGGDAKKARLQFAAVLAGEADRATHVLAARALLPLLAETRDQAALIGVLDRLATLEENEDDRRAATLRLSQLAAESGDAPRAIKALETLVGTPLHEQASAALEGLYEAAGEWAGLVRTLEERGLRTQDRGASRALLLRAAELRTDRLSDAKAAAEAWIRLGAKHGHDRETRARAIPLYEKQRLWDELAAALVDEAASLSGAPRAATLAKLAHLRSTKLNDQRGALASCREALSDDPAQKICRQIVLRALTTEDRELAADILEPIARREGVAVLLAQILEARASTREGSAKLALLDEAATALVTEGKDAKLALELSGRALAEAVTWDAAQIPACLARVSQLASRGALAEGAASMVAALGDRAIDHPNLLLLARTAGDASAASGDVGRGLALLRRALAYDPTSADLLSRVDALLREEGTPAERVTLVRDALSRTTDPSRRRDLYRAIASLQRRELADVEGAITTLRSALEEDPDDRGARTALLEIFAASGRLRELYEQLSLALGRTSENTEERRHLVLRMAEVSVTRGEPRVAREHYAEVLRGDDPVGDDVLDAVETLATSLNDTELLCLSIERRAALALDPLEEATCLLRLGDAQAAAGRTDDASRTLRRAAKLHEESGDLDGARKSLAALFALIPGDREARDALAASYRRSGAWRSVLATYETALTNEADVEERTKVLLAMEEAALHAEAAAVLAERMGEAIAKGGVSEEAASELSFARARLFASDPSKRSEASLSHRELLASPTIAKARALSVVDAYVSGSPDDEFRRDDRRALLSFKVEESEGEERRAALLSWARAEEEDFADEARAVELYRRVLISDPDTDDAYVALVRIFSRGADVAKTREALAALRDRRDGAERIALDKRLAELSLESGDWAAAITAVTALLESVPGDEDASRIALALLSKASTPEERAEVAVVLDRASTAAEEATAATAILDALLTATADDQALAPLRAGWFERRMERAEGPEIALEIALRAARELPAERSFWVRARSLAQTSGRPRELAAAYAAALAGTLPAALTEELGRQAVELHDEWLDDPSAVESLLERVFARTSASWAFDRLKALYVSREKWTSVLELYDVAIARAADDETRADVLEDAAQAADFAREDARAITYLEALSELRGDSPRLLHSLEGLYERAGRTADLVSLLTKRMAREGASAKYELSHRIATAWIDASESERALTIAETMIADQAERPEAYAVLERMLATERHSLPPMVEGVTVPPPPTSRANGKVVPVRQRAAALLKKRYQEDGRAEDLVRVLDVELSLATNKKDRIRRYRELAKLRAEGLGDARGALEDVAALAMLEPGELEHRKRLAALAEKAGASARHVDVLIAVASRARPETAGTILLEAAEACRDAGLDEAMSIDLFRRAMASPSREAALSAARSLAELLVFRPSERLEALDRVVSLERDVGLRREALSAMGRVAWGALGDSARARDIWRALAKEDPTSREAMDGLVLALEAEGSWADLVAVLEQRAQSAATPEEERRDRLTIARIHADAGDVDAALVALRSLVEEQGANDEVADVEANLLERAGRHEELLLLLDGEAIRSAGDERCVRMLVRAADVRRARHLDLERAAAGYGDALETSPTSAEALAGLETLLAGPPDRAYRAALGALVAHHRRTSDARKLVTLCPARVAAAETSDNAVSALVETAELHDRALADPSAALDVLRDAVTRSPDRRDVLDAFEALAERSSRWKDAARALEDSLAANPSLELALRREVLLRIAGIARAHLGDRRAAQDALSRAAEGEDARALEALVSLLRESPSPSLVDALVRWSSARGGDLLLLREAAEAAESQWDLDRASSVAEETLRLGLARFAAEGAPVASEAEIHALDGAVTTLLRAALERGDPSAASELAERSATLPFGVARKTGLRRRAAEIAERDLSDAGRAIDLYRAAIDAGDDHPSSAQSLARLLRREGRTTELIALQRKRLAVADAADRPALSLEVASLSIAAGDDAGAREVLESALRESANDDALANALSAILVRLGLDQEHIALWESQATLSESDPARARKLWARAAALAVQGPRAIDAYRRAAALGDPASLEALARLLVAQGDHAEAASALERLLSRAAPETREDAVLRLSETYVAAGRRKDAIACLEEQRARAPGVAIAERLSEMYRADRAWNQLAGILVQRSELSTDAAARHALLCEAADVHLHKRGAAHEAVRLLELAAELSPQDVPTALARSAALHEADRSEDAKEMLRSLIESYGARRPKERALVHRELGRARLVVGDRAGALAELDLAARIDPAHPGVLGALADLAFAEGQLDRAQRTYRSLLLLLPRRPIAGGGSRAQVLVRLAAISTQKGEHAKASELLDAAFSHAIEHPSERRALDEELRATERHELLARSLETTLASSATLRSEERAAISAELSGLYAKHLERPADALALLLQAIRLSPSQDEMHAAARALAIEPAARAEYVAALESLDRDDVPARASLQLHLGRALEGVDDRKAAAAYERAIEAGLATPELADLLEQMYERSGDAEALSRALIKRVETAVGPERAAPLYRLASVALRAGDADAAAHHLQEAMLADEGSDDAMARITTLAHEHPTQVPVLRLYERLSREPGRERSLIDALELLADVEPDAHAALREASELARSLGDLDHSERLLRRAVEMPVNADSRDDAARAMLSLAELRASAGALADAAALKDRAASLVDVGDKRALRLEVARLCATELGDLPRAAILYEALLAQEPGDPEVFRPLLGVYRKLHDDAALAKLIDAIAPTVEDASERAALRFERATIELRGGSADRETRTTTLLGEALDDDPAHREAAQLLSEILERSGKRGELATHLARRIESARDRSDAAQVVALSLRLGAVLEQETRLDEALDVYHGALDWDPKSRVILRAILRIGDGRDALDSVAAMERLLEVETGVDAADLAIRLALAHEQNGDDDHALRVMEAGYLAHPESERLRRDLAQRYAKSGAWEKTSQLHLALAATRSGRERTESLRKAAEALLTHAPGRAIATLEDAMTVDPTDRATLAALLWACATPGYEGRAERAVTRAIEASPTDARLFAERSPLRAQTGDFKGAVEDLERALALGAACIPDLLDALRDAIPRTGMGNEQRPLRRRRAELLLSTGDREGARNELTEVLRGDPRDKLALRELSKLEVGDARWDAAIGVLRRLLSLEEGQKLADCALELAGACDRTGRLADARGGLERAYRAMPRDTRVRGYLLRVYEALGERRELGVLTREDASQENDVSRRFRLLLDAARLFLSSDPPALEEGLEALEEAKSLQPEDDELTALLADATARAGRPAEALSHLATAIAAHKGRRSRPLSILYRQKSAVEMAEGELSAALESLERAFECDTTNGGLALSLGELAMDLDDEAIAQRAFRAVTIMKITPPGTAEGTTARGKAIAYCQMARLALVHADPRKARLFAEKSLAEDATFEDARELLAHVRTG